MSEPYQRSLTFRSDQLGQFAVLILVFDAPVEGLFEKKFPVVWRSSEFQSDGESQVSVTYFNQPGFLKPGPLHNDVIVDIATSQALDPAQATKLIKDDIGRFLFTRPERGLGPSNDVEAINGTTQNADIAFGFGQVDPDRPITPMYYWNPSDFEPDGSIQAELNPVLRAYVTDQYDDAKIVRQPISAQLLFEQNLSTLDKDTVWVLSFDPTTGQFKIQPDSA